MGMIRSLISLCFLAAFLLVGFTVPLGQRTLFGHVSNIWSADETQELVDGVKESSVPFVDRVKRGVQAGLADEGDAQPSATPSKTGETVRTEAPDPAAETL